MSQADIFRTPFLSFPLLACGLLLSACSTVSDVASSSAAMFSSLNPFGSDKPAAGASAAEEQAASTSDLVPAEKPVTIQVNNGASASVKMASATHSRGTDIEATVADNKQCTTFCALPVRRPPSQ